MAKCSKKRSALLLKPFRYQAAEPWVKRTAVTCQGRPGERPASHRKSGSLRGLLGIDIPSPTNSLLIRGKFTTTHGARFPFHLNNYLRVGDLALKEAFDRALKGDAAFKKELSAKEVCSPGRGNNRGPQLWEGKAISWFSRLQFAGRITKTKVPANGWYRVTIHSVNAVNPGKNGYAWGTLQTGSGYSDEPILYHMGLVEATSKPTTVSFDGWMQKDHILITNEAGEERSRKGGSFNFGKRDFESRDSSTERQDYDSKDLPVLPDASYIHSSSRISTPKSRVRIPPPS